MCCDPPPARKVRDCSAARAATALRDTPLVRRLSASLSSGGRSGGMRMATTLRGLADLSRVIGRRDAPPPDCRYVHQHLLAWCGHAVTGCVANAAPRPPDGRFHHRREISAPDESL